MKKKEKFNKRMESLKSERSSFIPVYRELSDYHLGYRGRFLTADRNKGYKRNTKQFNNTSRLSVRTLSSGMMAGITSPSRQWFRLTPPETDPELKEYAPVKRWLNEVQRIIYAVFSASNFYNTMHQMYSELGVFGTSPIGMYRDFKNVIWCKQETAGSYVLGANGRGVIDTRYYECEKTVGQLISEYGKENCSDRVVRHWDRGETETWIKIVQVIEPNDDRDMMSPLARDKAYRSVHYEYEDEKCSEKFLRVSGYDTFPILCARWDMAGEDIYATDCPGMTALGDTKALQLGEKRKYQALDKVANPPLQGDSSLRNMGSKGNVQGSEIIWLNDNPSNKNLSSIYGNWRPDLNSIREDNLQTEQRIKRAFYEDLFLMLTQSDRRQITATEVAERHEEKLLMLGPVLERLNSEVLNPSIDRVFDILDEAGVLPVPPPELQGKNLKVEYIGMLAQAQRLVATSGIERFSGFVGNLEAAGFAGARHKLNAEQAIDEYADALGVSPSIVRSDDEVKEMQQAEAQRLKEQQMMENVPAMAQAAKNASEAEVNENSVLGRVSDMLGNQQ